MRKKNNHCCELMMKFVNDPKIGIEYNSKYREYSIDLIYMSSRQGIQNCPFCGQKLPLSLRDNYFEILQKEYNLDNPHHESQLKLIPKEFTSDEWWKKRGL